MINNIGIFLICLCVSVFVSTAKLHRKNIKKLSKTIANVDFFACLKNLPYLDIFLSKNNNKKMQINFLKNYTRILKKF